ncbi:unnamed protein product [Timema podura]|uniref:Uncharacterized protein n=1 Tax=Timema podura TaxID=61482 RepID=A0ABN7NKC5_TIMPD|nr:unnamed protein product [Timema podura]
MVFLGIYLEADESTWRDIVKPMKVPNSNLAGDKNKRDTAGPNEIVTCTNCGPNPCTHSANNGCATEIRSVIHRGQPTLRVSSALQGRRDKNVSSQQVRKKEPPHPIRVAKTIDVIARITFPCAYAVRMKERPHPIRVAKTIDVIARIVIPSAYAIFLIFFFIQFKS